MGRTRWKTFIRFYFFHKKVTDFIQIILMRDLKNIVEVECRCAEDEVNA